MLVQPLFQAVSQGVHFDVVISTLDEFMKELGYPHEGQSVLLDGDFVLDITTTNQTWARADVTKGCIRGSFLCLSDRTTITVNYTGYAPTTFSLFNGFDSVISFMKTPIVINCPNRIASQKTMDVFSVCNNLYGAKIEIGDYSTSANNFATRGFYSCQGLVNCYAGAENNITSVAIFGFSRCTELSNCVVQNIPAQFDDCKNLSLSCSGKMTGCTGTIPSGYIIDCQGQINYS